MSIDLNALEAEMQMAQQDKRKMCLVPTSDLMSLLMRARELEKVQSMVPVHAGFVWPEDLHRLKCGELHRIGLSRRRGPKYSLEARVQYLPSKPSERDIISELMACV